jgi:hypothetical protein
MPSDSRSVTRDEMLAAFAPKRPPVERYARTTITVDGVTLEPGVQYERGEDSQGMSRQLRAVTARAVNSIRIPLDRVPFDALVGDLEAAITNEWPARAWFVEIHDEHGSWTQIFQPYGVPQDQFNSPVSEIWETEELRGGDGTIARRVVRR